MDKLKEIIFRKMKRELVEEIKNVNHKFKQESFKSGRHRSRNKQGICEVVS